MPLKILIERFRTLWPGVKHTLKGEVFPFFLDYPIRPRVRFGIDRPRQPQLQRVLDSRRDVYAENLKVLLKHSESFARIPLERPEENPDDPVLLNEWFPVLDALALYAFLREFNPRRYFEIGSGNSTRFARRAIRDGGLRTRVTSVDPCPRAEIDKICDRVIREPLEDTDVRIFEELEAGDVLFVDNSHRVFMNSDATVFFLDVLPRLKPGVLVEIHDIFLPLDYPEEWIGRHYSEQYLLAAALLAEGRQFEIVLPNLFVSLEADLHAILDPLWDNPAVQGIKKDGSSFWIRTLGRQ